MKESSDTAMDALTTILDQKINDQYKAFKEQQDVVNSLKPPTADVIATFIATTEDGGFVKQREAIKVLEDKLAKAKAKLQDEVKAHLTQATNPDELAAERGKRNALKNGLFHSLHALLNHLEDTNAEGSEKYQAILTEISSKASTGSSGVTRSRDDLADIRIWAKANGHQVAEKGRIAANVVAAYDAR